MIGLIQGVLARLWGGRGEGTGLCRWLFLSDIRQTGGCGRDATFSASLQRSPVCDETDRGRISVPSPMRNDCRPNLKWAGFQGLSGWGGGFPSTSTTQASASKGSPFLIGKPFMCNVVHLFNLDSIATEQELRQKGQTKYKHRRAHYLFKQIYLRRRWTFLRQLQIASKFYWWWSEKPQLMDKEAAAQYAGDTAYCWRDAFIFLPAAETPHFLYMCSLSADVNHCFTVNSRRSSFRTTVRVICMMFDVLLRFKEHFVKRPGSFRRLQIQMLWAGPIRPTTSRQHQQSDLTINDQLS